LIFSNEKNCCKCGFNLSFNYSLYKVCTPPRLDLVVKNINADRQYLVSETEVSGFPFYNITLHNEPPLLAIEKEGVAIEIRRQNSFTKEIVGNNDWYPAISLETSNSYIGICKLGYYSNCQTQILDYKGFEDLQINPSEEILRFFYNQYTKDRTIAILPDWEVVGKVKGSELNTSIVLTNFTITGNYKYLPPSEEYIKANEERSLRNLHETRTRENANLILEIAIIVLVVVQAIFSIRIIRNKPLSDRQKIIQIFLLVLGGAIAYLIIYVIRIFFNIEILT